MAAPDQSFPNYLTTVNASNFVSVKLSGNKRSNNYPSWKRQILCLIEATDLVRFINGTIPNPAADSVTWRTDRVVLGWILGSLSDSVLRMVAHLDSDTARDVWVELDKKFGEANNTAPPRPQVPQAVETEYEEQLPLLLRLIRREKWEAAKEYINNHPGAIRDQKTENLDTCLHLLAVSANKPYALDFFRFLSDKMTEHAWQAQNILGDTALHTAVRTGNDLATKFLLDECCDLMHVRNNDDELPIHLATQCTKEGSIWLLLRKMGNVVDNKTGFQLLCLAIEAEHFDVARGLIDANPELVYLELRDGTSILQKLALKDTTGRKRFSLWECFLSAKNKNSSVHHSKKNDHVLLVESLFECLKRSSSSKTIQIYKDAMLTAVENRSEIIVNEINRIFNDNQIEFSKLEDAYGNTPLHLVARLSPSHKLNLVSGAALQMQREIQWFKEVEKMCNDVYITERINLFEETPDMIFTYEHQQLKVDGERWMKDTANSCTIAAALIATVVFAAAITVPGGTESSNGYPLFSRKSAFLIFAVSDAMSLFTSTTSLLMFLSILTSRYAEQDFLYALPKRLCIGLIALFMSIFFMTVAFSVTLYLVFGREKGWILIPVAALACFPVTSFLRQQSPLLVDVIYNTYCLRIFKQKKTIR